MNSKIQDWIKRCMGLEKCLRSKRPNDNKDSKKTRTGSSADTCTVPMALHRTEIRERLLSNNENPFKQETMQPTTSLATTCRN
jgi:hypothetical protein